MTERKDTVVHHGPSLTTGEVLLPAEVKVEPASAHPSMPRTEGQALSKGHSTSVHGGEGLQHATRVHEKVDTVSGFSGHTTRDGQVPVHPDFGHSGRAK